jgi:hypothetical protein
MLKDTTFTCFCRHKGVQDLKRNKIKLISQRTEPFLLDNVIKKKLKLMTNKKIEPEPRTLST